MMAEIFLFMLALYLGLGLIFAIPFVAWGVAKIDPHAVHGSWGFRLFIVPGTAFLWPLLAGRWLKGISEPPEENNAHRRAALKSGGSKAAPVEEGRSGFDLQAPQGRQA